MNVDIEKIYLLITLVYDTETGIEQPVWPEVASYYKKGDLYIIDIDGVARGVYSKAILYPEISSSFWKSNIEKIILYDKIIDNDKTYLSLCYICNPNIINPLISYPESINSNRERSKLYSTLIIETFPNLEEMTKEWIQIEGTPDFSSLRSAEPKHKKLVRTIEDINFNYKKRFDILDSFFVIMPKFDNNSIPINSLESANNFLLKFEQKVKRSINDSTLIPYFDADYIETLHEKFATLQNISLRVFICTIPIKNTKEVTIPWGITNSYELVLVNYMLKVTSERLTNIYANKIDIKNYIKSISKKNIFKNYMHTFNNEKLDYLQTKIEIEDSVNFYKSKIVNTYPYKYKSNYDTVLLKKISNSDNLLSWSRIDRSNKEFDNSISKIEDKLKSIGVKDSFITNYLRDVITSESMWANLKLQKSIKWLTYIAVIFALISLIISLFDLEIKEFLKCIINYLI